ncbi:SymE family type I addiction module toxin [Gilliamella apicola]|uniref:SymE family type I addiction module toxin n=1 Tax=Gilliamella sp. wkB108 TaxID=3120256 RepID=UPI0009BD2D97
MKLLAKTHSKLKSTTDKAPAPQGTKPNPKPQLTIKGRWLEQIGFYVGSPVIIRIEQGKLIIELAIQF